MSGYEIAGALFALAIVALAIVFAIGLYVVRKYPNVSDPAREARRFVIPAAVGAVFGVALLVFSIGALATTIILTLT